MSKKKDKADEPAKTKSKKTSKKSSLAKAAVIDGAPAAALESPAKPRRAGEKKKKAAAGPKPTRDDIALRAYYIAEHRRNLNLPGDELGDWVEAERQLRLEALGKSP